jgi:hypothetical protein
MALYALYGLKKKLKWLSNPQIQYLHHPENITYF